MRVRHQRTRCVATKSDRLGRLWCERCQNMRFPGDYSLTRPGPRSSPSDLFPLPLAHDIDARRRIEMRAQNQRVRITMLVDEPSPGLNGKRFIDIRLLAPLRFGDLYGIHHHIAGDNDVLTVFPIPVA